MTILKIATIVILTVIMIGLGVRQYSSCLENHSFVNCSVTKGWGYMEILD